MSIQYNQLQQILRHKLDQREPSLERLNTTALREFALAYVLAEAQALGCDVAPHTAVYAMAVQVVQEAIGLGVLEPFLADAEVTEIMVNHYRCIYVERAGKLQLTDAVFSSEDALHKVIERIVVPLGRRIDVSSPMVDARLTDGSRVNAVIAPLALGGACLTIRKFSKNKLSLMDLEASGSLSALAKLVLELVVAQRLNVVISGGTGTGKTTLLNALALEVPATERVITVEDAAELQLKHNNCIALEARPANQEGRGAVTIRDLVRNALRMRPDRIVVGECRGSETLDMLQAMNTGHAGSFTTVHANSARDLLRRLEVMVLMSGMDLPLSAIRQQVASAIHIIVQITRIKTGQRVISSITEVVGMDGDVVQTVTLFERRGNQLVYAGILPDFYAQLDPEAQTRLLNLVA